MTDETTDDPPARRHWGTNSALIAAMIIGVLLPLVGVLGLPICALTLRSADPRLRIAAGALGLALLAYIIVAWGGVSAPQSAA